jgi:hypothetical protein
MDKLVDAAVELVEAGKLGQAVTVLQQGIEVLGAAYPGRWAGGGGGGRRRLVQIHTITHALMHTRIHILPRPPTSQP